MRATCFILTVRSTLATRQGGLTTDGRLKNWPLSFHLLCSSPSPFGRKTTPAITRREEMATDVTKNSLCVMAVLSCSRSLPLFLRWLCDWGLGSGSVSCLPVIPAFELLRLLSINSMNDIVVMRTAYASLVLLCGSVCMCLSRGFCSLQTFAWISFHFWGNLVEGEKFQHCITKKRINSLYTKNLTRKPHKT